MTGVQTCALPIFSSIPGTYTDLVLVSNVATTSSTNFGYYLNNDSANNYCVVNMYGNGSSTSSANSTTEGALWANWSNYTSTTVGNSIYISNIQNYASTSMYKTVITRGDFGGQGTEIVIGVWKSLSAVTSIVITTPSG